MVFDILAWGVTFLVGYYMGVGAERSRVIEKFINFAHIRDRLESLTSKKDKPI